MSFSFSHPSDSRSTPLLPIGTLNFRGLMSESVGDGPVQLATKLQSVVYERLNVWMVLMKSAWATDYWDCNQLHNTMDWASL